MKIGIDGNEANIKNRVGVNVYCFELLWALYKIRHEWSKKHQLIVYLKNQPLEDLPPQVSEFKYQLMPGSGMWVVKKLTPYLLKNPDKLDFFFSPNHYGPLIASMPTCIAIMDLGFLEFSGQFKFKDYWQLKLWTAYSVIISKCIISISNSTKKDIVRHYPYAKNKTFVTHLAYDKQKFNQSMSIGDVRRIKKKYSIVNDYILFLGTLKPSKNIEGLLDAWKLISEEFNQLNLVIAGKKGWLYSSIFEKIQNENIKNVIFTDFLAEEDKPAIIAGAKVFVLASFWEGFGLDVLNALASGVPVVVSDKGSLPEVAGDVGIVVDPYDPSSISQGLKKVLSQSKSEYNRLVAQGLKQAAKFDWNDTARKTLSIIEKYQ